MKLPYIVVTPKELAEYIQTQVDISNHKAQIPNKILEFTAALVLARFNLKQTGEHSNFAFQIKNDGVPIQELAELIQKYIDENTPIDILLMSAKIPLDKKTIGKTKSIGFQLKRFNLGSVDRTQDLKKFLTEDIPKKYAPVQATLVIILEGVGEIHADEINKAIHSIERYPFKNVLYMGGESDSQVMLGEIWPQIGSSTFTRDEWFANSLEGEPAN